MNQMIRFECGSEDRMSEDFGPFEFIQITYEDIRVGLDGERVIAQWDGGRWIDENDVSWTDIIFFAKEPE